MARETNNEKRKCLSNLVVCVTLTALHALLKAYIDLLICDNIASEYAIKKTIIPERSYTLAFRFISMTSVQVAPSVVHELHAAIMGTHFCYQLPEQKCTYSIPNIYTTVSFLNCDIYGSKQETFSRSVYTFRNPNLHQAMKTFLLSYIMK